MKTFFSNLSPDLHRLRAAGKMLFAITALVALFGPHPAAAQVIIGDPTLSDVICNASDNIGYFAPLLSAIAYIAGGILIGAGLLSLKDHTDNPGNNPLHKGIARLAFGAGLMTVPFVAQNIIITLFEVPAPGGGGACIHGVDPTVVGPGLGLDVLVENLVNNISGPFVSLLSVVAYVMGALFIIRGLLRGAKYGSDPRASSTPHILAYLIIGATLIAGSQAAGDLILTLFGMPESDTIDCADPSLFACTTNVGRVMGWKSVADFGASAVPFATVIAAALTFFQLIGMLAFVRGLYIVKNAVEGAGQATVVQGFTHIIGGVLAINIYTILELFDETFGTDLLI